MRIVAGRHRGARLEAPPGEATRPTSDRARQALFDTLTGGRFDIDLDDAVVLDLFAGTGALGLEALSRGAARAIFVEKDRAALAVLNRNIAHLKAGDRTGHARAKPKPKRGVSPKREESQREEPQRKENADRRRTPSRR